jgi:serine/threonine protein kinase
VDHREDAILCQHLLRAGAVAVGELVACAEAQREARKAGRPVERLEALLVARGAISREKLDLARAAVSGQAPKKRAGSSSGRHRIAEVVPADDREADGVRTGDRLGTYEVVEKLAQGSMGAVFRARCTKTGERVALKVMVGERAKRDTGARRFVQEAELACSLRHEGVVRGITFGVDAGRRYFVMELVAGQSLKNRIREAGRLPEEEVARVGAQMARALTYLHSEGVVHRDVKPANVLLGQDGQARLCDLGLARELEVPSEATASGDTIGTPRYMAPEQARGSRDAGAPADLYSLGVTLFHAATGRPPFPEESGVVVISRHLFDEVPDVRTLCPELSPALADLIFRLTRRELARRPSCAAEVARALEALLATIAKAGAEARTTQAALDAMSTSSDGLAPLRIAA